MIVFLFVLGLCLGSFMCATVWRLHEQMLLEDKKKLTDDDKKRLQKLSISKGRSMCGHCGHELAAKDLVPLLSWVWLRGKCRYCHKPIGWTEPLTELATGILLVVSYYLWPLQMTINDTVSFVLWIALMVGFVGLTVFDLKWYLLPDKIVFPLTILGGAFAIYRAFSPGGGGIIGLALAVSGGAIIFGLFYGLFAYSKERWIGGGDVKIAFLLGLLAGTPLKALLVIFLSSLLGTLVSLPLMAFKKAGAKTRVPFGPFLIAATILVALLGDYFIFTYLSLLGLQ